MAKIIFTIPSVLNAGNGEKKTELETTTLKAVSYTHLTLPTKA